MKVLILIPAYNEENNILNLINEIKSLPYKIDFLVINDASTDRTKDILVNNKINHISHPINLGLSESIKTGFRFALRSGYDAAVQIDGDGQHDPRSIMNLVKAMRNENLDFVQGTRFSSDNKRKNLTLRMFGSRIISIAIWMTTLKWIKDPTNGMRLFNNKLMSRFVNESSLYVEPDTIAYLIKDCYRWKEVHVIVRKRMHGASYFTAFSSLLYMIEVMFSIILVQAFRPKHHKKYLKIINSKG